MKIILIEPKGVSQCVHSGLAYLAGNLDKKHRVLIYDLNFLDWSLEYLQNRIKEETPDLIGISIKSPNAKKALKIASVIKEVSKALLVCGGPHITIYGLEFFQKENKELFNFGIGGEAELSFNQFCEAVQNNSPDENIAGLIYLKENKWWQNPPEVIRNLDQIKLPDYTPFVGVDLSAGPYPLLTSRGCPYTCIYCSVGKVSGRAWRARSPINIIAELKSAQTQYGFRNFEIIDDNFTLNQERVKEFCNLLIKNELNLSWSCPNGVRADKLEWDTILIMKESGCKEISLGIESGDPEVFKNIKKGESLDDIVKSVGLLKNAGIKVSGFFIVGLPGDSLAATKRTLNFIENLHLDGTKWNFLIPYPQTELWQWIIDQGRFLTHFTEGQHFSRDNRTIVPVFETPDFPAKKRIKAYKIANLATGNYRYVFRIPSSRFLFYVKSTLYLLYYSPKTLFKKVFKKVKHFLGAPSIA